MDSPCSGLLVKFIPISPFTFIYIFSFFAFFFDVFEIR